VLFRHVYGGADDFGDFARLADHGVRDGVKVLYRAVSKNDAVIAAKIFPVRLG